MTLHDRRISFSAVVCVLVSCLALSPACSDEETQTQPDAQLIDSGDRGAEITIDDPSPTDVIDRAVSEVDLAIEEVDEPIPDRADTEDDLGEDVAADQAEAGDILVGDTIGDGTDSDSELSSDLISEPDTVDGSDGAVLFVESPSNAALRHSLHEVPVGEQTWGDLDAAARFAAYRSTDTRTIQDALFDWFYDEVDSGRFDSMSYAALATYYGTPLRPTWLFPVDEADMLDHYRVQPVLFVPSRLTTAEDRTEYATRARGNWSTDATDLCAGHVTCSAQTQFNECRACQIENTDFDNANPHDLQPWFQNDTDFTASVLMYDFMWTNIQAFYFEFANETLLEIMPLAIHVVDGGGWELWMPSGGDPNPLMNNSMRYLREDLVNEGLLPSYVAEETWDDLYQQGRAPYIFGVQSGGGWAGAAMHPGFGGVAMIGEVGFGCVLPRRYDGLAGHVYPNTVAGGGWIDCDFLGAAGTVAHEMGHTLGLPHPADFGCGNVSDSLVMQNHLGYLTWPADPTDVNYGILNDATACSNPSAYSITTMAHERAYGSEARYHSELEVLEANPQRHDPDDLADRSVLADGVGFEVHFDAAGAAFTAAALNSGVLGWNTDGGMGGTALVLSDPKTKAVIATLPLDQPTFHGEIGVFSGGLSGSAPTGGAIVAVELVEVAGTLSVDLGLIAVEVAP